MANFNAQSLESLCDILKDYLTHSQIDKFLIQCQITNESIASQSIAGGFAYKTGTNKKDKLFNSFANEINKTKSHNKIIAFIEAVINPVTFANGSKDNYENMLESLNRVLAFVGLQANKDGKIISVIVVKTIDEVDLRFNSVERKMDARNIHSEVKKYCKRDILQKDYFNIVLEAAKGLAERVRQLSGLKDDGCELFQKAFSSNDVYLAVNKMETKTDKSEQGGLRALMEAIFLLFRNPQSHIPKINYAIDEDKAMDTLTMISFAHSYLDKLIYKRETY